MSTGNGTTIGYYVEARQKEFASNRPQQIGATFIGERWTRVTFPRAEIGVPNGLYCPLADTVGILSHAAALALIHWEAANHPWCNVEFRLVRAELTYSFAVKETGVSAPIDPWDRERTTEFSVEPGVGASRPTGDPA